MPFLSNLGTSEWVIIGVVVFFIFGSKRLTQLGKGLGESSKEIKKAKKEFESAVHDSKTETVKKDTEEKDNKSSKE